MVRTRDDLKRATFFTDGIIFDDFDFSKWTPEELIHLLSYEKTRSLPARYSDAHIDAYTPMIVTTNKIKKPGKFVPRSGIRKQREAIARRHRAVKISGALQVLGRPCTASELQARCSVGQKWAKGPTSWGATRVGSHAYTYSADIESSCALWEVRVVKVTNCP